MMEAEPTQDEAEEAVQLTRDMNLDELALALVRLRRAERETFQKYVDANESLIDRKRQQNAAFWERRKAALQTFVNEFGAPDDDAIDECMAARPSSPLTSKESS